MGKRLKILYFVTEDWYFCSHRLPLAIAAKDAGYDVVVVTRVSTHNKVIQESGLKLIPFTLSRRSYNPFSEIRVINKLISIYRSEKPDIVHHVAVKPVIYGTIASIFTRVPYVVNALAGLGVLVSSKNYKIRILRPFIKQVYRLLLGRKNSRLILQNPDDIQIMLNSHIITKDNVVLIRGAGVDTGKFAYHPEPEGKPVVILASRMLWDKGVGEFVNAAKLLQAKGIAARFILIGRGDPENPSSIPDEQLQEWQKAGIVEWWGYREDMPSVLAQSNIVCLPSYYGEGVPKTLIEAASCGRAIVTTNMPGCREIVNDKVNGILVIPRDAEAVSDALEELIISPNLRKKMGIQGRELVKQQFSLEKIIAETMRVYKELSN